MTLCASTALASAAASTARRGGRIVAQALEHLAERRERDQVIGSVFERGLEQPFRVLEASETGRGFGGAQVERRLVERVHDELFEASVGVERVLGLVGGARVRRERAERPEAIGVARERELGELATFRPRARLEPGARREYGPRRRRRVSGSTRASVAAIGSSSSSRDAPMYACSMWRRAGKPVG